VALKKLKEIFNKRSVRAGVLGVALLGAGAGGYLYMNGNDGASEGAAAAVITPYTVAAGKQESVLQEWNDNWRSICYVAGQPAEVPVSPRAEQMRKLLQRMTEEELVGGQAVRTLEQLGTAMCLNDHKQARSAAYGDATNVLTVKSGLEPRGKLFHALNEARHAVQQTQGMLGSVNTTLEENVRITFALEADAMATTVLAAWRLRERGDRELWQFLQGGHDSDLTTVFAAHMVGERDEMAATRAVFNAWYSKETRIHAAFQDALTRERNQEVWPVERPYFEKLPSNFFDRLGELGDGRNYGANKSPMLKQRYRVEG